VTDCGDIHLADLNEVRRRRVLVISNDRFHRASGRVLVAPEVFGDADEVSFPWRVQIEDGVYAVDLVRSLPMSRLLERLDRAPAAAMVAARRALLHIT
jgi:mRNA-degrading endonuclease toxin of MazEF toxin-antitoxin module